MTVLSKPSAETSDWPDRVTTPRAWQGGTPRAVVAHAMWLDDREIALLAAMGSISAVGSRTTGQIVVEEPAWLHVRGSGAQRTRPWGIGKPRRKASQAIDISPMRFHSASTTNSGMPRVGERTADVSASLKGNRRGTGCASQLRATARIKPSFPMRYGNQAHLGIARSHTWVTYLLRCSGGRPS